MVVPVTPPDDLVDEMRDTWPIPTKVSPPLGTHTIRVVVGEVARARQQHRMLQSLL